MDKLRLRTKLIFALGGFGKDAMFAMSMVMSVYFIDLIGVSSIFIGTMMMLVRVWDAINDPIMGNIVTNTESKYGKFRPWILIGTIINAIILIIIFANPALGPNSLGMFIYVTIFYTLWGMSYTLMDIPFWSMIPALSQSSKERETVTVLTRLFTSLGYFIIFAGWLPLSKILGGGESTSDQVQGLFIISIIVAIVFIVTQLLLVVFVKEQVIPKDMPKVSLKRMFSLLIKNDQLFIVMVVVLIANFVLFITSNMAYYFIRYDVANEDIYATFLAAAGVIQVIGAVLFPLFRSKLNRKKIYNYSISLQILGFLLLLVNAFLLDNFVPLIFIFGALIFFGQGLQMVLQTVLLADTVEYGEYHLEERSEALVFSAQTFIVKFSMGLSLGVIGVGLFLFRFQSAEETFIEQSYGTIVGLRVLMFVLPIIGLLISLFIFNKKHTLNEEKYADIVEKLRERNIYEENPAEL